MKNLRERKAWKILLGVIIVIALCTVVGEFVCRRIEQKRQREDAMAFREAKDAGYAEVYYACTMEGTVTLDGTTYVHYHKRMETFLDGTLEEDLLVKQSLTYRDETDGKTESLIIYGKTEGYRNDPGDEITYEPGKYRVLSPYRITLWEKPLDMWAVAGIIVLVMLIEGVLATILVIYFLVYFIKTKLNAG